MANSNIVNVIQLTEKDIPGAELTKPVESLNVNQLQRWLECHGEKKSGRRDELIKRVRGCLEVGKSVDPKVDGGKWYSIKEKQVPSINDIIEQDALAILHHVRHNFAAGNFK